MCDKKFIPVDFTWEDSTPTTFRLIGFWADSSVWNCSDPLIGIKFSHVNLDTGRTTEHVLRDNTIEEIKDVIMEELVKVFPNPIPKKEIGLTVEQIGEIVYMYCQGAKEGTVKTDDIRGNHPHLIRKILDEMHLKPLN